MPAEYSFDIVSDYDAQELLNAVDQTRREMKQRYDLKQAGGTLDMEKDALVVVAPSDMTLRAIVDVLESKMVRRGLDLKTLELGPVENASGGAVRQRITLKRGITQDLSREITKLVRNEVPKARAQVQGNAVRVSSKSKDELQRVMTIVRKQNYDLPVQFVNYR